MVQARGRIAASASYFVRPPIVAKVGAQPNRFTCTIKNCQHIIGGHRQWPPILRDQWDPACLCITCKCGKPCRAARNRGLTGSRVLLPGGDAHVARAELGGNVYPVPDVGQITLTRRRVGGTHVAFIHEEAQYADVRRRQAVTKLPQIGGISTREVEVAEIERLHAREAYRIGEVEHASDPAPNL